MPYVHAGLQDTNFHFSLRAIIEFDLEVHFQGQILQVIEIS